MSTPGNEHRSGTATVERFKEPSLVNGRNGNRLVDAINAMIPPGSHGQIHADDQSPRRIMAWITGNTRDGSNYRWKYSWQQIAKTAAGYGGNWGAVTDGYSGSSTDPSCAYNRLEDINTTTGGTGAGVVIESLTASGYALGPVQNNVPVMIDVVILSDGTTEYWFSAPNSITGSCA